MERKKTMILRWYCQPECSPSWSNYFSIRPSDWESLRLAKRCGQPTSAAVSLCRPFIPPLFGIHLLREVLGGFIHFFRISFYLFSAVRFTSVSFFFFSGSLVGGGWCKSIPQLCYHCTRNKEAASFAQRESSDVVSRQYELVFGCTSISNCRRDPRSPLQCKAKGFHFISDPAPHSLRHTTRFNASAERAIFFMSL